MRDSFFILPGYAGGLDGAEPVGYLYHSAVACLAVIQGEGSLPGGVRPAVRSIFLECRGLRRIEIIATAIYTKVMEHFRLVLKQIILHRFHSINTKFFGECRKSRNGSVGYLFIKSVSRWIIIGNPPDLFLAETAFIVSACVSPEKQSSQRKCRPFPDDCPHHFGFNRNENGRKPRHFKISHRFINISRTAGNVLGIDGNSRRGR